VLAILMWNVSAHPAEGGINVWTSNGPVGGIIRSLALDPGQPTTLYAGTDDGVFKSVNGGVSWSAAINGLDDTWVLAVAVDPSNSSTLYAGTSSFGGVFKSSNGGASWAEMNVGLSTGSVSALAIDPLPPRTLYAGTSGAFGGLVFIFKSIDGGGSWSPAN